jgi:hypothetical protein
MLGLILLPLISLLSGNRRVLRLSRVTFYCPICSGQSQEDISLKALKVDISITGTVARVIRSPLFLSFMDINIISISVHCSLSIYNWYLMAISGVGAKANGLSSMYQLHFSLHVQ